VVFSAGEPRSRNQHGRIDPRTGGVVQALYGNDPAFDLAAKPVVLRRLQADGFWLIDAADRPINHLSPGPRNGRHHRRAPVATGSPGCRALAPSRGVICHRVVYQMATRAYARPTSNCCMPPALVPSPTGGSSSPPGSARRSP
jgi:hypothetical protein